MNPSLCKSPQDCPQVLIPELLRLCILPRCQDPQPNLCPRLHIGGRRTPNSVPLIYRTARAHCAVRFRTPNPPCLPAACQCFPFSQCCLGELFQQTPGFSLPRLCRRLCPEAPPSRPKHDLAHVGTRAISQEQVSSPFLCWVLCHATIPRRRDAIGLHARQSSQHHYSMNLQ